LARVKVAAEGTGQQLVVAEVIRDNEIDQAFTKFAKTPVNAVLVGSGPFFRSHKQQIVELAARYSLPASYSLREYVEAGGLMSYGTSITNSCREAGLYAARILKGEKPSELPVIQSTKFELALNLKTSKALGLSFPQAVLLAADEVIE
jgi:putative tryptophan/tyrosine transport system substrate-binding protein